MSSSAQPSRADLARADEIDAKCRALALGFVDATIVALAERVPRPGRSTGGVCTGGVGILLALG